jgi:SNF2 family DNA or RNA helicase
MVFAAPRDRVAFWHPIGSGKTATGYYVMEHIWKCPRILVVGPTSSFGAWETNLQWTDYDGVILSGTAEERAQKLEEDHNVYVINYEGLKYVYGRKFKVGKKNKWSIDTRSFVDNFEGIIFDEAHRCKSYSSLQSQICCELSRRAKHVIGLSGTPFDKNLLELFNVYKAIDQGQCLGSNFFRFRLDYFKKGFYDWEEREGAEMAIFDRVAPVTLLFERSECNDLPACNEVVWYVDPSPEFRKWESRILTNKEIKIDGCPVDLKLPTQKSSKYKQLLGGYIYYDDADCDERHIKFLKKSPKISSLMEIIEDHPVKIIVFYMYDGADSIIQKALDRAKVSYVTIKGGQGAEKRRGAEKAFLHDPSVQVCVCNTKCGGESWEGYSAGLVVFYDIVTSPTVRKQCIGRMFRDGQEKETTVIELVMRDTFDERAKENQGPRADLQKEFNEYMVDYGGT